MKAIQLLVNSQLPPDLRDYNREFDSKSLGSLMADVARKYPEQYERISKAISDIGRKASYFQGESLTLEDNRPVIDRDKILAEMDNEIEESKRTSIDKDDFESKKVGIWHKYNDRIQTETSKGALAKKNNLAYSVMSGARGKPPQLKMMLSTPGLYTDSQDNIIPLFIRTSFAEGLRPAEYLAGTYGARKSVLCLHEDTLVRMADGSSLPIKYTKPGMFVLGADKEGNTFPTRVVRVYNQGLQPVYRYIFVNGQEVVCTKNHKFLSTDKKHILTIEDIAKDKNTISATLPASVSNCYDIEVEHEDHLFVLDNGIITSNSTKRATAKGGDLAKQMVQSAANLVVSENDCGAANGIDLEVDDKSLRGRVLARDLGNVPAGTVLDKSALASIRKQGFEKLIARSPMTCQAKEGVCARCMGLNALGKFPSKGETVGITAAQSIGEPICLHEDTLVRMADFSNKKIKDIVPGDMVLGSDMLGNLTPTRVVNVFHNGIRDGVRTKIRKGCGAKSEIIELMSTKEHKVLSYQGRDVTKAVPVIQPIAKRSYRHFVYLSKGLIGDYGTNEPLADILGILIGDGCYTVGGSAGVCLSCYDAALEEYVRSRLDSVGLNLSMMAPGEFRLSMKDQYSSFETIDGALVRNTIKAKLIKEGMWGQASGTKTLPSSISTWDNKSVASLIGGLIATDGWICRQKSNKNSIVVGFGSNSLPLLQSVKDLLEIRFGIYSSRVTGKNKKKARGGHYATNYTLTVTGIPNILELQKQINIPGCKQGKLNSYIRDISVTEGHRGRYSVISQEPIGKIDTWDIEVDNDTHLFSLANSLIVSNTQGALNCLAKNTLVLMHDHSEKAIQDIRPGDLVMGADTQGNIFPTEVTHVWDQGMQPVQRRYYKMGQTSSYVTLESTAAHPLLSNRKTYGINQGKNNATPEKLIAGYPHKNLAAVLPTDNISSGKDEPWAVFLGAFLGDGIRWDSTSEHTTSVKLSCADISEIEDINSILRPLNVQLVKCARSYDWRFSMLVDDVSSSRDASGRMTSGYRNPCKLKLIEYGLDNKYAYNKAIHPGIWQWSVKSVAALIAGFIATDGSVYKNKDGHIGVAFTSTSKSLLEELQRLLRFKLCVYSSRISLTGKTGTGCRKHDQWQFTVTRLDQIKRLHNFIKDYIPGCKKQKLQSYIDNSSYELRNTDYFYRAIRRNDMEEDLGMLHCYDITVAHKDSLFVLANSLIVSNTKHQGGAAGADRRYAGFAVINQFVQTPDTFPDKAILSRIDGQVNSVIEAPQGGYYVTVDNEPHYVAPGYPVTVKVGDRVEAGDTMSEGLPDPGEVVELRGLGEGRKYYADKLKQLLDDSGMEADRRNTELMSRAALDHLQITDAKEDDEYLPDDVVSYSYFSNRYTPPKDTNKYKADKAIGTYLQSPALHYTIGTRITPKIATHLKSSGFDEIFTSPESPTFKPHMVRLRAATHHGDDWLASMHTSYLKKQLSDSAIRGEDSNVEKNIHFAPRLAIGTNFGENIEQTGKF